MNATHTFSAEDLAWFANRSGDFNPIHVDAAHARRLLGGGQVVHGVFTLLLALDHYAAGGGVLPQQIQVFFRRPVLVNEPLQMTTSEANGEIRISIRRYEEEVASILMQGSAQPSNLFIGDEDPHCDDAADHNFAALTQAHGEAQLTVDAMALHPHFTHLPEWMGLAPLAAMMACSRIVGMDCPGLHSLFTSLSIQLDPAAQNEALSWRVTRHSSPAAPLKIAVSGGGITGEINAMMRPAPVQQPTMAEVLATVSPNSFVAQHALIIGGSRGLGELTAKVVAAGGGQVVITYLHGREDAERVAAEIGPSCRILQLDVLSGDAAKTLAPHREWMTHLYYFATARINKGADAQAAAAYEAVYVTAFDNLVNTLADSSRPLRIFYPSSVFVTERPAGFAAYSDAKAKGEALCDALTAYHPHVSIRAQRLPRLQTDQTSALLASTFPPALPIVREYVTAMQTLERPHGQ